MIYQHVGAPAHFATNVRAYLDNTFQDRCIGRGGPVAWPPRSPDMTPLNFFLWGYLNNEVYRYSVQTVEPVVARLQAAVATINISMLQRVQTNILRRAEACVAVTVGNFEHLLR
ncbi:PREDICTED: uncharacterized protein LOC107193042 [Dufourea novaeangliae]|uniref:uncharacterized protein LOC107193042 n=1 Tax=Dufourea novaeangliae TaxID=178035 RepID=UPI000767AC73|nr:PREDICTED: uncharacterized protein LOC107193042 [Dufourea novaeangliae]